MLVEEREFGEEFGIDLCLAVRSLEFLEGGHECLGNEPSTELAEMTALVRKHHRHCSRS